MAKSAKKTELESTAEHLPADISLIDQIKKDLEQISQQVEASPVEKIKLSAKGFVTPDGETGATLRGVIVDFASANAHYPDAYDANNPSPPNCFAVNKYPSQMKPDPRSTEPQADHCEECPKNKFESGVGKSKACKNTRVVAFMQENANDDSPIWKLSISPEVVRGELAAVREDPPSVHLTT